MTKSDGIFIGVVALAVLLMWRSGDKPNPGPEPLPVPPPSKLVDSCIHELRVSYANTFREAAARIKRLEITTDDELQKMLSEATKLGRQIAFTPLDAHIERELPRDENGKLLDGADKVMSRIAEGFQP
jgi:hypothetical protein